MQTMQGRRALVTGGAHGIGRATCLELAARGARVAVLDVDAEAAEEVAKTIDGVAGVADVGDAAALGERIDQAARALGGLDTLVNNAGAAHLASLDRTRAEDFERMVHVNLAGTFHATRCAIPLLRAAGGGAIVNVASGSGVRPTAGESAYAAAKAGVIALTRAAANEYGPEIRVNCVSPGLVRTRMTEGLFRLPGALEPVLEATPLRRAGTPEDVARVIVFLASDASAFVTGQNLVVDGGLALQQAAIDPLLKTLLARMES